MEALEKIIYKNNYSIFNWAHSLLLIVYKFEIPENNLKGFCSFLDNLIIIEKQSFKLIRAYMIYLFKSIFRWCNFDDCE